MSKTWIYGWIAPLHGQLHALAFWKCIGPNLGHVPVVIIITFVLAYNKITANVKLLLRIPLFR